MVNENISRDQKARIKRAGVDPNRVLIGIGCGAYPNIDTALERIEDERKGPEHIVRLQNICRVNDDIDQALFRAAQRTNAWSEVEDFKLVFVLEGSLGRGAVLHQSLREIVWFKLELHRSHTTRFLRFRGDDPLEREKGKMTRLQLLAGKMGMPVESAREVLEHLVRNCDQPDWIQVEFPFVLFRKGQLSPSEGILKRHGFMIHSV